MMEIRNYNPETDYPAIEALYKDGETFGGQFDEARDTKEKLDKLEATKPGSVLLAEHEGRVVGSATLFEDGRAAWLYRFAVARGGDREQEAQTAAALWAAAKAEAKQRGHSQVLVYAPLGEKHFFERYTELGFTPGGEYQAFWQDI